MKILVVFTGGTIGSTNADGVISPDKANSFKLLNMYSKIDNSVEFVSAQPYNILSENVCFDNMVALCDCIKSYDLSDFDGVIVTHGTDTLQYSSAYLSYYFGLCKTPIVVVSANYPLEDSRSNGLDNFCAAVNFIKAKQGRGVFVSYTNLNENSKIHRASRALPHLPYSDLVFSIRDEIYGELHGNEFVANKSYADKNDELDFSEVDCNSEVLYIRPFVGMSFPEITENTKAILLEGYHSGTLNTSGDALQNFCKKADEKGVMVFLTGSCQGFNYESKDLFDELKINVLPPASPIAMYVKLSMLSKDKIMNVYIPRGGDFSE